MNVSRALIWAADGVPLRPGTFRPVSRVLTAAAGLLALGGWLSSSLAGAAEAAPTNPQVVKQFKFKKTLNAQLNYLLFLPKDYAAKSQKRWPLMLFLHGAGERGSDIWKVTTHGPPKIVAQRADFPCILVSPQCPDEEIWSNDVLLGLLDYITRTYAVDTHRVYLTGLSMGGYGTWSLGLAHPDRFAAIVPICGGGDLITVLLARKDKAQALKTLGVWAFHGSKDPVVPTEESQRMVDLLKKVGASDVKLTVYPEAGHDSWTETYNNPDLYNWLLSHRR
jgi:predicted peptidase